GTAIAGEAKGIVTVAMRLPNGITFEDVADVGGSGWICSAELSPGTFTCNYNIAGSYPGGELPAGDSLPLITANVVTGSDAVFTLQSNTRKATVRMLQHGGSCGVTPIGYI